MFGDEFGKVTGGWEKLRNEGLHNCNVAVDRAVTSKHMRQKGYDVGSGEKMHQNLNWKTEMRKSLNRGP